MTQSLYEVRNISQHDGESGRRWFTNEHTDLYIWFTLDKISAFEFCYNKHHNEHVLRWDSASGFTHARIDDGEHNILKKSTPIATTNGVFAPLDIIHLFESSARFMHPPLYRFILIRLYSMLQA
jgi:hypothetical protein